MADARSTTLPEAPYIRSPATYREADAFVRPARPAIQRSAPSTLTSDLLTSLKSFTQAARPFLEDWRAGLIKQDQATATEAANASAAKLDKNRQDFNALIKDGSIPPGASPWFRNAYYKQVMRIAADEYDQALHTAYENSPVKGSDDPATLAKFSAQFREQWVKQHLGDITSNGFAAEEFLPRAQQAEASLAKFHTAVRTQEIEKKLVENTQQEIFGLLDRARRGGQNDPATIGAAITGLKDKLIANGARGSTMTKAIVDAIKTKAVEENNSSLFKVLAHIKTGTGVLANTQYARAARYEAEKAIEREGEHNLRMSLLLHQRAVQIEGRKLQGEAMTRMLDNPHADVTDLARQAAKLGLGPVAKWMIDTQYTLSSRADHPTEDHSTAANLIARAYMNPEDGRLAEDATLAAKQGHISVSTLKTILSVQLSAQKNPAMYDRFYKDAVKSLRDTVGAAVVLNGQAFISSDRLKFADEAAARLTELYMPWWQGHPEATPEERYRKLRELTELVANDPAFAIEPTPAELYQPTMKTTDAGRAAKASRPPSSTRPIGPPTLPTRPTLEKPKTAIPAAAIEYLKQHPELAPQFDNKYGPGTAEKILKESNGRK